MPSSRNSALGSNTAAGGDVTDDCIPLSESRYILAKYRLKPQVPSSATLGSDGELKDQEPVKMGPDFLTPNIHGGQFRANKETCCQFLWCLCVPCISTSLCWIRCCESIYECIGKYLTTKEEESEMVCCTMGCCKL